MNNPTHAPMYDARWEHDACGIGFVTCLDAQPTHAIVAMALEALSNLEHRGALDADGRSGDGAGILTQLPYRFFAQYLKAARADVPAPGDLAVAMCFLPLDHVSESRALIAAQLKAAGIPLLAWRAVPTNDGTLGIQAMRLKPMIMQALLQRPATIAPADWERTLYQVRRAISRAAHNRALNGFYIASMSARTIVHKGLMQASQLGAFYPDLEDSSFESAIAVYHQRFSTNTFPSWERAQPFRMVSHNGEINTLSGNIAAMTSREPDFGSPLWGDRVTELWPVLDRRGSDSAMLDNALDLLVQSGRDVRHALTMLVPPAWEHDDALDAELRAFYQYHSCMLAPWDGPAALCFSDGTVVGMALDRNGLRPARYIVTDDGIVVAGSEVGAVALDPERIVRKGRLGPGQMVAVDLTRGMLLLDDEIKRELAARAPYRDWIEQHAQTLEAAAVPASSPHVQYPEQIQRLQAAFGYDAESIQVVLKPMARDGHEPVGSMGDDTPIAPLAQVERPLYSYFRQRFAQVTNPPIDPLRERLVMSLGMTLGRIRNLLDETPEHAHMLRIDGPILNAGEFAALQQHPDPAFRSGTIPAIWPVSEGAAGLQRAVEQLQQAVEQATRDGIAILILSDRPVDAAHAPIPAMLAVGAAHHHLLRCGMRARTSLVLDSGEPREVHHMACLIGYGAEAIHPYLALATVHQLAAEERQRQPLDAAQAERSYIAALDEGLRKILSKMGIATLDSYHGAQLFEAVGIGEALIDACFADTASRVGGIGWAEVAADVAAWHARAFTSAALLTPGIYKFKKDGEYHAYSPAVVHALHQAVGIKPTADTSREAYRRYTALLHQRPPVGPRDLLHWQPSQHQPLPLDQVEPAAAILRRFSTAAMSVGSTSAEAHETLAIAMTRLGGMSNSGEGGEDPARFRDERNSGVKQIASGRFGVTPAYLMSARELQIKMAQGAKPGEGGQLPGHKVSEYIARIRHTMPGATLISPPPHHDIYSIEDLAQLIYDLKQINPQAAVSVKLVSEAGVGTIASGVVKAGADVVLISGHSGGTGASPLSSIKNAGVAWELGLAETQQTLLLNGLRHRVRLRVDGGLQSGRDVVVAALLGADEFSFGTAAVVAEGCLMARACHSNTCPVGIATQRPELRAKFPGTPEHVMHFFGHLAEEVRETLAELGAHTLDEIIGRSAWLHQISTGDPRADQLDFSALLVSPCGPDERPHWDGQHVATAVSFINARLLDDAAPALNDGHAIQLSYPIANTDRTIGATLAGVIARRELELAPGMIEAVFTGSAGQSFGAFAAQGVRLVLVGDANDYVGKSLGGGEIVVRPPQTARYTASESTIIGNTVLYGATGGMLWAAGQAGERFAVRNSGALAVVEGIGDHGCEYMTGGLVVVLGLTGRNFGAGMSGGRAYVLDERGDFTRRLNDDMVRAERLVADWQIDELRALIQQHVLQTDSPRGRELLTRWERVQPHFWHVVPRTVEATPIVLPQLRVAEQVAVAAAD